MGMASKLPCGVGVGAAHSRVLACQGLRSALGPANKLQKKLITKGICDNPSRIALTVMNTLMGCRGCRNSYCVGL